MAKLHKKKSKRMKCRKKCKKEEHRYKRSQERKKCSKLRKLRDTVPYTLAFEEYILLAEQRKQRVEDLREAQKDSRQKLQMENRTIEDLIDEATQKVMNFNMCNDNGTQNCNLRLNPYYTEFKEVIETADVILEILDARDPLGSRCPQVEQLVLNRGKLLVLVLNKIDLIPKNNLTEWLKYLRQELPTVAFKASIQIQNSNVSEPKDGVIHINESLLSSLCCVGSSFLINFLETYCRNQNVQSLIKVGVVGFPNVGKSSVIKSLKQSQSSSDVGATDITNAVDNLSLYNQIEILDTPGIVYAKDDSSVTLAVYNCVKVEDLKDVISPAEAIVQRVDRTQLSLHYCIPQFSSCHELFCSLAAKMGKFKKANNPDFEDGARRLINDWNTGKIKYYTHPPEKFIQSEYISAEYIAQIGKAFDISLEKEQIELEKAPLLFPTVSIAAKSSGPTEGLLEEKMKANDYALAKVITELDINKENKISIDEESDILNEYQLHKLLKKKYKKMKHKKKKSDKLALALSESIDESLTLE